jgi:nucleoside-triphosphatase
LTSTHVLLLTGPPGIGKTSVVRRVIEGLPGTRLTGFTTEEIRVGRQREGFRLEALDGRSIVLAHVNNRSPYRVGKYGVDIGAFDGLIASVLDQEHAAAVYLIDEIGKMECLSGRFVAAVTTILESTAHVIATIAARGDGFIERIKQRPDADLWQVTRANRDELPLRAIAWLKKRLSA